MTMPPGGEVITVSDAPLVVDEYGNGVRDWSAATTGTVTGCSVQPFAASETTIDREYTATHMLLFAPWGAAILATSRVTHQGTTYEVDGEPGHWRDDMGTPDHTEAALKRLAG